MKIGRKLAMQDFDVKLFKYAIIVLHCLLKKKFRRILHNTFRFVRARKILCVLKARSVIVNLHRWIAPVPSQ